MGVQPKPSARFWVQRTSSCKSTLWQKSSETKFFQVNGKAVTQKRASPGHSGPPRAVFQNPQQLIRCNASLGPHSISGSEMASLSSFAIEHSLTLIDFFH